MQGDVTAVQCYCTNFHQSAKNLSDDPKFRKNLFTLKVIKLLVTVPSVAKQPKEKK